MENECQRAGQSTGSHGKFVCISFEPDRPQKGVKILVSLVQSYQKTGKSIGIVGACQDGCPRVDLGLVLGQRASSPRHSP